MLRSGNLLLVVCHNRFKLVARGLRVALLVSLLVPGGMSCSKVAEQSKATTATTPSEVTALAATGSSRRSAAVYTTFYPLTAWTEFLLDGQVPVHCPLPPDADPIFWQPSRATVQEYQAASLIVTNGAEFEKWLQHSSLPPSRVIQTALIFQDRWLHYPTSTHVHGGGGAHSHEGVDGHTWLDPIMAQEQARQINRALQRVFPELRSGLELRGHELDQKFAELDQLGIELTAELKSRLQGRVLLASHPAYQYLAQRYQWPLHSLDLDPDAELNQLALASLNQALVGAPGGILLWEKRPSSNVILHLREQFEVNSVEFNPLEHSSAPSTSTSQSGAVDLKSAPADYFEQMKANFRRLEAAL
jgi:zinc transport system substrate-binding protein